jgi:hypothetical protein
MCEKFLPSHSRGKRPGDARPVATGSCSSFDMGYLSHRDRLNQITQFFELCKSIDTFRRLPPCSKVIGRVPGSEGDKLVTLLLVADNVHPSGTSEVIQRPLCKILPFFEESFLPAGFHRPVPESKYHSLLNHRHHRKPDGTTHD